MTKILNSEQKMNTSSFRYRYLIVASWPERAPSRQSGIGGPKKSIASADFIQEIAEHSGGFFNDGCTLFHSPRSQPFLPFFLLIQMESCDVVTDIGSKLLFELAPEFPAFFVDLCHGFLILGIGSPYFHPNRHDRTGEGPTKGPFPPDPPAKPSGQSRDKGIFYPEIVPETQGDRFRSVKPLVEVAFRLLGYPFCVLFLSHASPRLFPTITLTCSRKPDGSDSTLLRIPIPCFSLGGANSNLALWS